ncbi:MAG: alpha-ketoglutarate-dependent dioxygenase AlkB family protein [Cellvibrionaceae bacterium]
MTHQPSLFDDLSSQEASTSPESIAIQDGELQLFHRWLSPGEVDTAFAALRQELAWEQSRIQVYGKSVAIPRLNAWYGDKDCHYAYSGYRLPLNHWHPQLLLWRQRLQEELSLSVNSALANLYRNGDDGVGWHSDDEPELGEDPTIASISLGAPRMFHLKHRFDRALPTVKLSLPSGSLLVMSGKLQRYWLHSLPKTKRVTEPRINLTFRHINLG